MKSLGKRLRARLDAAIRWRVRQEVAPLYDMREELDRIGAQLAALEQRLEGRRLGEQTASTEADTTQMAEMALLAQIRAEHRRVRARIGLVANYVQRLEALEAAIGASHEPGGIA